MPDKKMCPMSFNKGGTIIRCTEECAWWNPAEKQCVICVMSQNKDSKKENKL